MWMYFSGQSLGQITPIPNSSSVGFILFFSPSFTLMAPFSICLTGKQLPIAETNKMKGRVGEMKSLRKIEKLGCLVGKDISIL